MEFVQKFSCTRGSTKGVGSAIISEDCVIIRVNGNKRIKEVGTIQDGLGCVTEDVTDKKSPSAVGHYSHAVEYLPENFKGNGYKFRIEGKQISENEFVYLYKDAKMMNKK